MRKPHCATYPIPFPYNHSGHAGACPYYSAVKGRLSGKLAFIGQLGGFLPTHVNHGSQAIKLEQREPPIQHTIERAKHHKRHECTTDMPTEYIVGCNIRYYTETMPL